MKKDYDYEGWGNVTGGADGREAGGIGQEVEWKEEEEVIRDERGDMCVVGI